MSSWPPPDEGPGQPPPGYQPPGAPPPPPAASLPPSAPPPPPTPTWQAPPPPAWGAPPGSRPGGYGPAPAGPGANQLSLVSMCLGIGGLAVTPCCSLFAFPIGVGALATGIIGLVQVRAEPGQTGKGQAIAGIICGALAMVLPILFLFLSLGMSSFSTY